MKSGEEPTAKGIEFVQPIPTRKKIVLRNGGAVVDKTLTVVFSKFQDDASNTCCCASEAFVANTEFPA